MLMKKNKVLRSALAGGFLAMALLLPFLTASNQQIGNMFLPMHIPVLLCGFLCGPFWGLACGAAAPLLRSLLFSMPVMFPTAAAMSFELAAYGFFCGLLYRALPKKYISIYASLLISMIIGRAVWGVVSYIMLSLSGGKFGWEIFISSALLKAIPGIILQLVIIPPLVILANRSINKSR